MSDARQASNEHFVPRLYLRAFVDKNEQVWVFDKISGKAFRTNIKNVGSERNFFKFPDISREVGVDPQVMENEYFVEIEGNYERLLADVKSRLVKKRSITPRQKNELAFYLAIQFMRTRSMRNLYTEIQEKAMTEVAKINAKLKEVEIDWENVRLELDERYRGLLHAGFLTNPEIIHGFARALHNHIWLIRKNNTKLPFYTSDAPVSFRTHKEEEGPYTGAGIGSWSAEVVFPISPQYILVMLERDYFSRLHRLDMKVVAVEGEETINYYNRFAVINSERQIYCPTDQLELAQAMCDEYPELKEPNQPKVIMGSLVDL